MVRSLADRTFQLSAGLAAGRLHVGGVVGALADARPVRAVLLAVDELDLPCRHCLFLKSLQFSNFSRSEYHNKENHYYSLHLSNTKDLTSIMKDRERTCVYDRFRCLEFSIMKSCLIEKRDSSHVKSELMICMRAEDSARVESPNLCQNSR